MATTTLLQRHAGEGETIAEAIRDCLDYGKDPEKTESGKYISAYECDPATVADEFLLAKASYAAMTGREQKKENNVLCYQIRQSFYPGEITPKEANRIGYELAIIIIDDTAYMLSMAGEKLFNIERAYKGICLQKVAAVEKMRIVTDFELFRTCASSGHNPRRFVAFNDEHLKKLENSDDRRRLAEKFGLPLLEGKFDTTQNGVSEKLVKLLCNKGMVDPFDDLPMEVSSPRKWE